MARGGDLGTSAAWGWTDVDGDPAGRGRQSRRPQQRRVALRTGSIRILGAQATFFGSTGAASPFNVAMSLKSILRTVLYTPLTVKNKAVSEKQMG